MIFQEQIYSKRKAEDQHNIIDLFWVKTEKKGKIN